MSGVPPLPAPAQPQHTRAWVLGAGGTPAGRAHGSCVTGSATTQDISYFKSPGFRFFFRMQHGHPHWPVLRVLLSAGAPRARPGLSPPGWLGCGHESWQALSTLEKVMRLPAGVSPPAAPRTERHNFYRPQARGPSRPCGLRPEPSPVAGGMSSPSCSVLRSHR